MHASDNCASCAISSNFLSEVEELGASQRRPRAAASRTGVKDGTCVHHQSPRDQSKPLLHHIVFNSARSGRDSHTDTLLKTPRHTEERSEGCAHLGPLAIISKPSSSSWSPLGPMALLPLCITPYRTLPCPGAGTGSGIPSPCSLRNAVKKCPV